MLVLGGSFHPPLDLLFDFDRILVGGLHPLDGVVEVVDEVGLHLLDLVGFDIARGNDC